MRIATCCLAGLLAAVAGTALAEECRDISGTYRLVGDCVVGGHTVSGPITVAGDSCEATASGTATIYRPGPHPYDTCALYVYDCETYDGRSTEECEAEAHAMEARGECERSSATTEIVAVSQGFTGESIQLSRARTLHTIGDCRIHSRAR